MALRKGSLQFLQAHVRMRVKILPNLTGRFWIQWRKNTLNFSGKKDFRAIPCLQVAAMAAHVLTALLAIAHVPGPLNDGRCLGSPADLLAAWEQSDTSLGLGPKTPGPSSLTSQLFIYTTLSPLMFLFDFGQFTYFHMAPFHCTHAVAQTALTPRTPQNAGRSAPWSNGLA